ncbi:hypothetical protein HPB48_020158 [Haemaphysalis longicornis]|uniref:Uncharacterized protein n=1 Tax=Haemaphysalis longicornis TaxID=44386 RepID=A0A9J6FJ31_HAELO|nr:hypothetical protein HPB48_020158 [Haemaphysalis longicornis]
MYAQQVTAKTTSPENNSRVTGTTAALQELDAAVARTLKRRYPARYKTAVLRSGSRAVHDGARQLSVLPVIWSTSDASKRTGIVNLICCSVLTQQPPGPVDTSASMMLPDALQALPRLHNTRVPLRSEVRPCDGQLDLVATAISEVANRLRGTFRAPQKLKSLLGCSRPRRSEPWFYKRWSEPSPAHQRQPRRTPR